MKPLALALAALGLAGATLSPAHAAESQPLRVKIDTAGLDLASAEGQRELDRRVKKAVRTVCRVNNPTTGTRLMSQETRECLAKAQVEAKRQMALMISNQQRGG